MPLYDFRCPRCGRTEEVLVRRSTDLVLCRGECNRTSAKFFTDPPKPVKPQEMERQPSAPSVRIVTPPDIVTTRRNGMKITTTDNRPRRERA